MQSGSATGRKGRAVFGSARVALCHEKTTGVAGSEKVAAALAEIIRPDAVFTLAARPADVARVFPGLEVWTPRFGLRPAVHRRWSALLPLILAGWGSLSLRGFDVVVTSSHSFVNAVRPGPASHVICYCHTPMRYAWAWRDEIGRVPGPLRPLWPAAAAVLRRLDRAAARKVGTFIANSGFIAERIRQAYGMPSTVIHPPVDTSFFTPGDPAARGDHFLLAGRHVAYKRPDIAVDAARQAGVPLIVAGSGPLLTELRARAAPGTRFLEEPSDEQLRDLYREARALLFPGLEDFGITPVEAMACGTPVIAYDGGGAVETVIPRRSGVLVSEQTAAAFASAMAAFPTAWDASGCRAEAERFSPDGFRARIVEHLGAIEPI